MRPVLYVTYWKIDKDIKFGKTKGSIVEIQTKIIKNYPNEHNWAVTKIEANQTLFDKLMTGIYKINCEQSNYENCVIDPSTDDLRFKATKFIKMKRHELLSSTHYKQIGEKQVYIDYIKKYLEEFLNCTRHIPFEDKFKIYPLPLITPCKVEIFISRDGIIFNFKSQIRPEIHTIISDSNKILDELLLPHPRGRTYSSIGPNRVTLWICDDEHCVHMVGDGIYTDLAEFGNPLFVIFEPKYHSYIYNLNYQRNYPSTNITTKKYIEFAEIFGDHSPENFTLEKATNRARLFAYNRALSKLNAKDLKLDEIKSSIDQFKDLISKNVPESKIENFINNYPWILEKGLGYKKYYSQINIPEKLLYKAEGGIKPDKYIENNNGYCDIVDLKKANVKVLVKKKNRNHASYQLTEAESQIDKYIEFSKEPKVREYLKTLSINLCRPNGIVIIGRTPMKDIEKWREIKDRLKIQAYTYDEILLNVVNIINWIEKILKK